MKILRAIKNSEGKKKLIVLCNCGTAIEHPIEKERITCSCDKKITSSKKMLVLYYKNRQAA